MCLMTMSSKVYAVIEYGGEYEDSWQHIIGICCTSELADELKAKIEESHNKSCKITANERYSINEAIENWEEDHEEFETIVDGIKFLFPDSYSDKDIQDAIDKYNSYGDYLGVQIQEVPYYTNLSDTE